MTTELGRIATLLERVGPETTPLQRRLAELGRILIVICLVMVAVIVGLDVLRGDPVTEVLLRAGSALWRDVLEKRGLEGGARPTADTLARWKRRAAAANDGNSA